MAPTISVGYPFYVFIAFLFFGTIWKASGQFVDQTVHDNRVHLTLKSEDCNASISDATIVCNGLIGCRVTRLGNGSYYVAVSRLPTVVTISHPRYQRMISYLTSFHEERKLQCLSPGNLCSCQLFKFNVTTPCGGSLSRVNVTSVGAIGPYHIHEQGAGCYTIATCRLPVDLTLSKSGFATLTASLTQQNQTIAMACNGTSNCGDVLTLKVTSDCVPTVPGVEITSSDVANVEPQCPGLYRMSVCKRPANLTLSKLGFATQSQQFSRSYGKVHLQCSERPYLVEQPQSKSRQLGQSAQFCCKADVIPATATIMYKWYHNGAELPGATSMTFTRTNIQASHAGTYKCMAFTDVGGLVRSIISEESTLSIVANEADFSGDLTQLMVQPSPACLTLVDVGYCEPRPCKTNISAAETCAEDGYVCPETTIIATVTCPPPMADMSYRRIISCKCCPRSMTAIDIEVSAFENHKIIPDIVVYIFNKVVGRTDASGRISPKIKPDTKRVVIKVEDETKTYLNSIKVLRLDQYATNPTFVPIKLVKRAPAIVINSTVETTLNLHGPGKVVIPASSACSITAEPYSGPITVYYTFLDPSVLDQIRLSPGEFVTADENGELKPLVTHGVFNLQMFDSEGNPLSVNGINILEDQAMQLWALGTDGTWVRVSSGNGSRKKRQISIGNLGNLDPTSGDFIWYNIDKFPQNMPCWIKARVYDTTAVEITSAIAKFKPEIEIYTTNYEYLPLLYYGYQANIGQFCFQIRCDNNTLNDPDTLGIIRLITEYPPFGIVGPLLATPFAVADANIPADLMYFVNGQSEIEAKFYSSVSGPFYSSYNSCIAATGPNDQAFRFEIDPPTPSDHPSTKRCVARIAVTGNNAFMDTIFPTANLTAISEWGELEFILFTQLNNTSGSPFNFHCVEVACPETIPTVTVSLAFNYGNGTANTRFNCQGTSFILPENLPALQYTTNENEDLDAALTACKNSAVYDYAHFIHCELALA